MRTRSNSFKVYRLNKPNGRWKVEGRPAGKRERYYFVSEKEAKTAASDLNLQIAAFGTQNLLSDTERVAAREAIRILAPYGKSLYDAAYFYRDYLDLLASSVTVSELADRVRSEFDRRLASGEISKRHAESMRETVKKLDGRFDFVPYIALSAFTGLRREEICRLDWSEVKLDRRL